VTKTKRGRASSILGIAAQIAFDDEKYPDTNYIEAIDRVFYTELLALGLVESEIDLAIQFDLYPHESRIERLITDFKVDKSHWAKAKPLSADAYEQRLAVISLIDVYKRYCNGEGNEPGPPSEMMNIGAEIAWYAYAADLEIIDANSKAALGAIGGKGRRGKIYSPARKAFIYAMKNGYKTQAEIESYFETQPTMDDLNIRVYFGKGEDEREPDTFSFENLSTGKISRPMKRTSLASAISQVRPYLKDL